LFIGTFAAIISSVVVHWKTTKTSLEDTLDVFPCHGVGGIVGMIMTGLLAHSSVNSAMPNGNGLFHGGDTELFFTHIKALLIVVTYTFVGSMVILKVTDLISPILINPAKKTAFSVSEESDAIYSGDLSSVNVK